MNELEKVIAQYQDKLNDVTNNYQQKIGKGVHDNFWSFHNDCRYSREQNH